MEMSVGKEFLMAVLNESVLQGREELHVHSPLLSTDLLRLDIASGRFNQLAKEADFDKALPEVQRRIGDDRLIADLPGYGDFRDAFRSSLIVLPENFDELVGELREVERRKREPYRHPKERHLAIDTNIAYLRVFSRLLLLRGSDRLGTFDPTEVPIIIPSLVEEEISQAVGRKYGGAEVRAMKGAFDPRLAGLFINCLFRVGRRAMNAQTEVQELREKYGTRTVQGGRYLEDKERRDEEIVRSIAEHAQKERIEVVYVTNDDKARAHAYTYRLPSLHIRYPRDLEVERADSWLVPELLYDLALSFGVLRLKGIGVEVLGIWPGKSADDYLNERLRLQVEDGALIREDLDRTRRVIERLGERVDTSTLT